MNEKIYLKVAMVFFTLVGLAGGAMSIAGPVVGLTLNPNDLTAVNFRQVERFGLDAALYFDCGEMSHSCRPTVLRHFNALALVHHALRSSPLSA
eukprot:1176153-Prorocentrum_minimum.AAC.3